MSYDNCLHLNGISLVRDFVSRLAFATFPFDTCARTLRPYGTERMVALCREAISVLGADLFAAVGTA